MRQMTRGTFLAPGHYLTKATHPPGACDSTAGAQAWAVGTSSAFAAWQVFATARYEAHQITREERRASVPARDVLMVAGGKHNIYLVYAFYTHSR